jgi:hypothetical protein
MTPDLRPFIRLLALLLLAAVASGSLQADEPGRFSVPGHDDAIAAVNELFELHQPQAFTTCTLWDAWLPHATLWTGKEPALRYRRAFLTRRIDDEGYVSMQQHRGMAHSEGWPFPAWQQSEGVGFHFSNEGDSWAIQNFALTPLVDTAGWEIEGAEVLEIDRSRGLRLQSTGDVVVVTTPAFSCDTLVAPFARLEWAAAGLGEGARPMIEWLLEGEADWPADRQATFRRLTQTDGLQYANIPLHREAGYGGRVVRYRLRFDQAAGSRIDLKSIITAVDTRHPITGPLFVRGASELFLWTRDVEFLREIVGRMRQAVEYTLDEFDVREQQHVVVSWVGHDGRSGLVPDGNGDTTRRVGLGVGNNYWDLLPFGGHDGLATIYTTDALHWMGRIEAAIEAHPEWSIPAVPGRAAELRSFAEQMRADFQTRFWDEERGRFVGWIDAEGTAYDYGFTFVNLEAIAYGMASPTQAEAILEWIDGERIIEGDTSTGSDIYHWRFAPRATTKRNIETYTWPWYRPQDIPWGNQVQDGGAVLGFSYHDLMARLATRGPDDAWQRLREILAWFREVQDEGGYRAYYAKPGRGTLQGGGPPGGLGLDREFMESVLVPQVMLDGFLGFQPTADGYTIQPRLPSDWPSLTVRGIHLHGQVLDVTAHADGRIEVVHVVDRE